jgi:hypothetical protein
MSDYRAISLAATTIIDSIDPLCGDDRSAIEYARQHVDGHDIEL